MNTKHIALKADRTLATIAVGLLPIAAPVTVYGQATYTTGLNNMVTSIRGAIYPNTNPTYTSIEFQTGANGVLWVDQSASFSSDVLNGVFTTTRFVSDSNNRVSASLLGTDEFITPIEGRSLCVQNLFLDNVDFDTGSITPGAVQLKIQARNGGDMTLGLNNSSLTGFLTPEFWALSRLYFNVGGSSQISQWSGTMGSPTTLNVTSGSTFRIKDSGSLSAEFPIQTLNFGYDANYANDATVNGAKLILDHSNLRWGSNVGSTSEMNFNDNATLQLMGQSKLRTHNLNLRNSALDMSNNTRMDVTHDMLLDNSTITAGSGAGIHVDRLTVKGLSSIAANGVALQTTTLDLTTPGSNLVLKDDYDGLAETRVSGGAVLFPTTGAATTLNNQSILTISDASMALNERSIVVNGPRATMDMQGARFSMDGSAKFTNERDVIVRRGQVASTAQFGINSVIHGGTGSTIRLECAVEFDPATRAQNSLTTANELFLDSRDTVVSMYIDPTSKTSDRFILEGRLNIDSLATLTLGVVNDTVLQPGEKFILFDFNDGHTMVDHFGGLPDGSTLNLGQNVYEVLYNDPDVKLGSTSFITLTSVVVPEPSTWTLLGLGAAAILVHRVWRRK